MPCCSITGCKNRTEKNNLSNDGISYHRFPHDPDIKLKWIESTGRKNWLPTQSSIVCSRHFETSCFIKKKFSTRKFLSKSAVPTKHVFIENKNIITIVTPVVLENCKKCANSSDSASSYKEISEDMEEYNFQGSNNISEILVAKNTKIKNQFLKIKNLQAQNRRLRKKIHILELLTEYRKKISMENENFYKRVIKKYKNKD